MKVGFALQELLELAASHLSFEWWPDQQKSLKSGALGC